MIRCVMQRLTLGALIALMLCGAAGAQQGQQPDLVVPDDLALAIMIKTALIAYNHANATGNYTVLRDLASPGFQQANTPERLAEIFKKQRDLKIDLSPIVLLQPKLARKAWIDERRLLRLQGFFESRPAQVNFTLAYQAVAGRWRLFAVGVETATPKAAAAPGGNPAAQTGAPQAQAAPPVPPVANPAPPTNPTNPFGLPDWLILGK